MTPTARLGQALRDHRGVVATIAVIACVAAASTLTYPLLTLLMERAGVSSGWIGLNTALAAGAIFAFGGPLARAVASIGAPLTMAACLLVMALCLLGMAAAYDYWWWSALRFLLGGATGGLYLATEYWVVSQAPERLRGRLVSAYALSIGLAYAVGPAVLRAVGVDGFAPFAAALALLGLAAAPLAVGWSAAPPKTPVGPDAPPPLRYFRTDPSLVFAVVVFGVLEFGAMGLTPLWARLEGYSEAQGITFAILIALGGPALLPLIGWLSDRTRARPLLLTSAAISLAVAAALPFSSGAETAVWALLFVWGGTAIALYTVALTEMGARYHGAALAGGNAAIVMGYGLGATMGPPLVGASMEAFGPDGMPLAFGAVSALFLGLVGWRGLRKIGARG